MHKNNRGTIPTPLIAIMNQHAARGFSKPGSGTSVFRAHVGSITIRRPQPDAGDYQHGCKRAQNDRYLPHNFSYRYCFRSTAQIGYERSITLRPWRSSDCLHWAPEAHCGEFSLIVGRMVAALCRVPELVGIVQKIIDHDK
jgi:hypothetical protein